MFGKIAVGRLDTEVCTLGGQISLNPDSPSRLASYQALRDIKLLW